MMIMIINSVDVHSSLRQMTCFNLHLLLFDVVIYCINFIQKSYDSAFHANRFQFHRFQLHRFSLAKNIYSLAFRLIQYLAVAK